MARLVNPYTVIPNEIQMGDVLTIVVKALVVGPGRYRLYKCRYDSTEIPQGMRIPREDIVCRSLFPTLAAVATHDEY